VRVLLLVHHFPPDVNSTGQLMAQLGEGLVARGHEVTVLTTFPHYAEFRTWPEYRGKLWELGEYRGMPVYRVYSYAPGNKSMRNRLGNYVSFNLSAALRALPLRHRFDAILATNGSFFTGVTGWLLAGRRMPLIYNLQDLYPHVPIQAGQLTSRRQIAILRGVERFMYRHASHLTVITPSFREYLLGEGIPAEKVTVIPNFVDTEFIRPLPKDNEWSRRHGLADKFVVAHAGALGYVYDLGTMVEVAARLKNDPGTVFVIVGDGVQKAELEARAQALSLDNVRFLPFQPAEDLPLMRATFDVQVALYRPGAALHSMPSKVYEIMASGRAVVAGAEDGSDLRRLVEDAGAGVATDPGDVDALERSLRMLRGDGDLRERMGRHGRACAEAEYAQGVVVGQYDELLRRTRSCAPAPGAR